MTKFFEVVTSYYDRKIPSRPKFSVAWVLVGGSGGDISYGKKFIAK